MALPRVPVLLGYNWVEAIRSRGGGACGQVCVPPTDSYFDTESPLWWDLQVEPLGGGWVISGMGLVLQ